MIPAKGYATHGPARPLEPFEFERREPGPEDVQIELLYCGICHSDLHMVDNDFGFSLYPMVPGHEMVGRVVRVGAGVTKLRPGDIAGVGCFIDSCRTCAACEDGLEQYCESYPTGSFSAYERGTGQIVQGGFSTGYVVDERFALKVPLSLDPAGAAPLLCGGITTYSALRHCGVDQVGRIGVVGLGGLGHLAVKFARAFGVQVVCFTTSEDKAADARRLGADEAVLWGDAAAMQRFTGEFGILIDTVSAAHDIDALLGLLRRDGTLCLLGLPTEPVAFTAMNLVSGRRRLAGSGVGGLPETQEMLDFCGEHRIEAEVEVMPVHRVNEALSRLRRGDVKYRFVLDLQALEGERS